MSGGIDHIKSWTAVRVSTANTAWKATIHLQSGQISIQHFDTFEDMSTYIEDRI